MALLSFLEELKRARPEWPFDDMDDAGQWTSIWCAECRNVPGCPLPAFAAIGRIPYAWHERENVTPNKYTCEEFEQNDAP